MTCLNIPLGFRLLVTLGEPMDNILAIGIFALPLAALAIILLIYQRHLTPGSIKRTLMIVFGIIGIAAALVAVLYAASSALPWGFGSYDTYLRGLQLLVDLFFGSATMSLLYIGGCIVFFVLLAHFIIAAPEPDLVGLRTELKTAKEEAETGREATQKLEVENKRLNEFLSEKEDSLAALEGELESIKAEVGERAKAQPSGAESTLRTQVQQRDKTIEALQSEVADLRLMLENAPAVATAKDDGKRVEFEKSLQETQAKWTDLARRAETASEVSDSVISDLVELISQVQSSKKDDSAKQALISLIEGLGRSMTRVSREAGDIRADEPKIEMIGAIIMTNEIVDAIKKMIRQ
jgi:hypothetical protein